MIKILMVDDNSDLLEVSGLIMELENSHYPARKYLLFTATNTAEEIRLVKQEQIDILITDINRSADYDRRDGLEVARDIRRDYPNLSIIVTSANNDQLTIEQANKIGINAFLVKPYTPEILFEAIDHCLNGNSKAPK